MESVLNTQSTLKPDQVTVLLIEHAVTKHTTRYDKVFFKAVLAGLMLSFGGIMNVSINAGSTDLNQGNPALVKILGGFVFPTGFVLIVMLGLELLTSNMMVFPIAVAKRAIPWWSLPLNWLIVTFGNLAGSLFSAAILVHYSGIFSAEPFMSGVISYAEKKAVDPQWHQIFLRGIGCNILVCIAVWLAAGAKETVSKLIAIWIPIWVFVAASFDHVIANMFYIPLGIMFGADLSAAGYIQKSLIATYLGNIVGAAIVWIPAVYFYLGDYSADGLRDAEQGKGKESTEGTSRSDRRRSSATMTNLVEKD
ncbi:putative formate/nitrite transporter [Dendrothele bispora CBS 962.96]|uniref:Putative formate/nitrite transporter n=1 Tax=Dendrothele bispora (strain CBS 962.96) TaxID=1314807 RepID=A0A4V4HG34_DENBC|nr:putative formate/nitrite transporter [Dendrothele bispora CBS 962.96]